MTESTHFDPETDLDNTRSEIPYKNGVYGTCAHKTEDGYLSVETNDAGEITNVARLQRVDPKTCLFDSYGVMWLNCDLNDQIIADFPGILTASDGWKQHHADKRLNGNTYVLHRAKDDTYLSHENGVDHWISVEKDQFGNAKIPESCWLSEEERDLYLPLEEGVQVEHYSYLEFEIIPMMEDENDDEMNADSVDEKPQWYEVMIKVTYEPGIYPPGPGAGHDIIYISPERLKTFNEIEAEVTKACTTFNHFGDPSDWQSEYDSNLPEVETLQP